MREAPLQGVYELGEPGEDVELFLGEGALNGEPVGPVRIWMSMSNRLRVRWQAENPLRSVDLERSQLSIDHPQLGPVEIPLDVHHSDGWGTCPGTELGTGTRMARVVAHWPNLPMLLPGSPLESGKQSWAGRWTVESCGWRFTLDCRQDYSEVRRSANESDKQFALTHVGELRRADSGEFDAESARDVLFGWQLAFSFALGRWVAPALPVGLDREEQRVWEQWAPWRCDTLRGYESWWDTHTADDLAQFFAVYLQAYLDHHQRPIVRHVAMHMITGNHSGTTAEGKVMLAQAGLEYLAWVTLVLTGVMSRRTYREMTAAERLRLLLNESAIPLNVPRGLEALSDLADQRGLDGPDVTAWVRNRLVHPKDADEPYRIEGLVWQAAQLLLEYGELLLLHRLGYTGRFMRRYPPHRWAHSSEPVPWATTR
ncbi:MAG: hypothetical protein WD156_09900 [Acidimicrobiia bacterium]